MITGPLDFDAPEPPGDAAEAAPYAVMVMEVVLSLTLLIGAGLLMRTYRGGILTARTRRGGG
jgi:hypothetical protein